MGNGITKNPCFSGDPYAAAVASDPLPDDSHGHSFTYVPSAAAFDQRPTASAMSSEPSFFSLSGAAISANVATSASMPSFRLFNELTWPPSTACTFESSRSFAAVPLQAAPPRLSMSGPLQSMSGRFLGTSGSASTISGSPSDRPFMPSALDRSLSASSSVRLQLSVSQLIAERRAARSRRSDERSLLRFLEKTASRLRFGSPRYGVRQHEPAEPVKISFSDGDHRSPPNGNVEWAQGMAGEDRFHVAVSEEHGWVFVGIYDGFNGPDATDYLFANLYVAVHRELKGVLWDDIQGGDGARCIHQELAPANAEHLCFAQADVDRVETKRRRMERPVPGNVATAMHRDVLRALARALRKTEEAFFDAAEERAVESPELGLMGSCVLVMLMKGADLYVMNVGDSRAVLARRPEPDLKDILGKAAKDLQQFKVEIMRELEAHDRDGLQAVQLTPEHSTAVEEEVMRIKEHHLNDRNAIVNGRVKGKLNVTRAFGVGYLKQPKWNSRLLEAFKINYVGTDPYVTCTPSLCHHRIGAQDKFLVLSSDGLYQYFTNKEVVDQVEAFTAEQPDGDPAQHLVAELVIRAARKAGMASHELLDIPHGARRHYHDDVSIIVISFEGRIWRSSV
ncbi:probable protein phosphatase 2C 31 [Phragmites australis]|uniref:probable protein phosphatase 2C 31 n=1 Tax=Phragmites australis TaxID=29695 RepID=UPI002D79126A|nr:probable protein phosphatase 2C 31 [Phragmites australis]